MDNMLAITIVMVVVKVDIKYSLLNKCTLLILVKTQILIVIFEVRFINWMKLVSVK